MSLSNEMFRVFSLIPWILTVELFSSGLSHAGEVSPHKINSLEPIANQYIGKVSFSEPKIPLESAGDTKSSQQNSNLLSQQSGQGSNIQPTNRWYVGGGLGLGFPSISGNGTVSPGLGAASIPISYNIGTSSGIALNAFAGLKSSFGRSELEVFYTNNSVNDLSVNAPNGSGVSTGTVKIGGNVSNFAVMLNGYYDISTGSKFTPYLGGGVGYGSSNLKLTNPATNASASASRSGLVYQLKAGVAYAISDNTDIYLHYRYLNAPFTDPSFNGSGNINSSNIEIGTKIGL